MLDRQQQREFTGAIGVAYGQSAATVTAPRVVHRSIIGDDFVVDGHFSRRRLRQLFERGRGQKRKQIMNVSASQLMPFDQFVTNALNELRMRNMRTRSTMMAAMMPAYRVSSTSH